MCVAKSRTSVADKVERLLKSLGVEHYVFAADLGHADRVHCATSAAYALSATNSFRLLLEGRHPGPIEVHRGRC